MEDLQNCLEKDLECQFFIEIVVFLYSREIELVSFEEIFGRYL